MSDMEFFIGTFEKAPDQSIVPKDEDDFYELEEADRCYYVRVGETLYKAWPIADVEKHGFETALPITTTPIIICYWYNGGAGVHEVVEGAIEKYLKENPEPIVLTPTTQGEITMAEVGPDMTYTVKKVKFGDLKKGSRFKTQSGAEWFKRSSRTGVGLRPNQGPQGRNWDFFSKEDLVFGEVRLQ